MVTAVKTDASDATEHERNIVLWWWLVVWHGYGIVVGRDVCWLTRTTAEHRRTIKLMMKMDSPTAV